MLKFVNVGFIGIGCGWFETGDGGDGRFGDDIDFLPFGAFGGKSGMWAVA